MMFKYSKRAFALVISLIMILSLAACGGKNNTQNADKPAATESPANNSIVGTWKYTLDFKTVMESEGQEAYEGQQGLYESMLKAFSGITLDLYFEFDDNHKFKFYADEESAKQAVEQLKSRIKDLLPDMFEAMGVSKEDYDKYLAQSGMTEDELAESYTKNMDTDDLTDMSATGIYKAQDGKLYMANEGDDFNDSAYISYEISGNKLRFTEFTGDVDYLGGLKDYAFPMEMERTK